MSEEKKLQLKVKKGQGMQILLFIAVLIAVLVPCMTLFEEGDWLYYVIREEAMKKAWIETALAAGILTVGVLRCKTAKAFSVLAGTMLLAAACLHSMLLPLLLAGFWFFILMLSGDFLTGISITIILAALLSLVHACTPLSLLIVVSAVMFLIVLCKFGKKQSNLLGTFTQKTGSEEFSRKELALAALVVLVLYVQIARANQCIDFDSLWYGVRSAHVLCPGGSIFEDLGLVGMVYTYSKGFEILTLPLSILPSYAGISAFNLFLFVLGLKESAGLGKLLGGNWGGYLTVLLTALVPGIVNMTLSAKPDMITWLLQLMMLRRFFAVVGKNSLYWQGREKHTEQVCTKQELSEYHSARIAAALQIIAIYLVSLTMKPTALIFSTALLGMMFLWTLYFAILRKRNPAAAGDEQLPALGVSAYACVKSTGTIVAAALSLLIVWGRTMKLTGMPFTSVFSGVLEKLGFALKYPFTSRSLPSTWQEGSQLMIAVKRFIKMLLSPDGSDMKHVIIAWGGSMFFVLLLVVVIWLTRYFAQAIKAKAQQKKTVTVSDSSAETLSDSVAAESRRITGAALTIFLPFLVTNFITLMMLYQVDGNYYMTAYSVIILLFCMAVSENNCSASLCNRSASGYSADFCSYTAGSRITGMILISVFALMAVFQFTMMTMTNWAGVTGYFPIQKNVGYYDHVEYYKEALSPVDGSIYEILSQDPETRLVSFGDHPTCLQFPCVVQSYNDITSPWGNVEIVNTADAMIDYLHFAGVDYVYANAEHLAKEDWQWSKGLLEEMLARGVLTIVVSEGDDWLAKVN